MRPFRLLAADRCPALDELVLAVAAEFRAVDADTALACLDALGAELAERCSGCPRRDALACRALLGDAAGLRACTKIEPEHLMLDAVLGSATGHPLVLTVVYAEVARRAGVAMCPVGAAGTCLVALAGEHETVVLDPHRNGTLVPQDRWPPGLRWLCPHEAGFAILGELVGAYALRGDLCRARRAAALRLALPLDDRLRARVELELKGLDSHLN